MGESGDPRKQERPDGREPGTEVTAQFPPSMSGVITEFGASVVPFPFKGNNALRLEAKCGPLVCHLLLEPEFADKVCELIQEAKLEATSDLRPATVAELKALAGNGAKA